MSGIVRHGSFSTDWVDPSVPLGGAEEIAALRKTLDEERDKHLRETVLVKAQRQVLEALEYVSDQELRDAIASPITSHEITEFARAALRLRELDPDT